MEEQLYYAQETIKEELIGLFKHYSHGVPTYNDSFRAKVLNIIDNQFTELNRHEQQRNAQIAKPSD